jgi:hypothetical protein
MTWLVHPILCRSFSEILYSYLRSLKTTPDANYCKLSFVPMSKLILD